MNEAIKTPTSWSQNDNNLANTYLNIAKSLPMITQWMKSQVENIKNGEGIVTMGDLEEAFQFLEETINNRLRSSMSDKIKITWVKTTPTSTSANKIHDSKQYNKKSVRITESELRRAITNTLNNTRKCTTRGVVNEVIGTLKGKRMLREGANNEYDEVDDFHEGFARVRLKDKYNFIDINGVLLSPNQWFDECGWFQNGTSNVRIVDDWYIIDTEGGLHQIYRNYNYDYYGGYEPF